MTDNDKCDALIEQLKRMGLSDEAAEEAAARFFSDYISTGSGRGGDHISDLPQRLEQLFFKQRYGRVVFDITLSLDHYRIEWTVLATNDQEADLSAAGPALFEALGNALQVIKQNGGDLGPVLEQGRRALLTASKSSVAAMKLNRQELEALEVSARLELLTRRHARQTENSVDATPG